ncbi:MAG: hypothetical protein H0T78_05405 [Longispora sp.]|nr:hypothetical protein [Longispora sp. (in: high G+C Gram-positive bacteria)]
MSSSAQQPDHDATTKSGEQPVRLEPIGDPDPSDADFADEHASTTIDDVPTVDKDVEPESPHGLGGMDLP